MKCRYCMAGKGRELAERRWLNELDERRWVVFRRGEAKYLKRQASRARRRQERKAILDDKHVLCQNS